MTYKKRLVCMNCDIKGHSFRDCCLPVRSYGIIAYKNSITRGKEFLLIQRKDTIGKTDFLRGKYKNNGVINYYKLKCLIHEMTDEEKFQILNSNMDVLWDDLWIDHSSGIYRNEKPKAIKLFNEIDSRSMILESFPSRYVDREWGFPKGRKNLSETGIQCATREFIEETGLSERDFIIDTSDTYTEEFIASDDIKYTHIYYIARVRPTVNLKNIYKTDNFRQEVSNIDFFDYKSAYKLFRDYDTQKKHVLTLVNNSLR